MRSGFVLLAVLLALAGAAPSSLGHDDSGSRYPGSNDDAVAGTYRGSAGFYSALTGLQQVSMMCDLEVGGDGNQERERDEETVDGTPGTGIATVPDGTWDDGGTGGACHTDENHYANPDYNTPGCIADTARASDAALGGAVWIAAACDWFDSDSSSCGADGTPDAIAFGAGNPGVAYPTGAFAASGCPSGGAAMMVFVLDSVSGKATSGVIWAD
ncbi:MAG: hypothetical protein ACYC2H_02845 [Thermoplasmatota archaeon]